MKILETNKTVQDQKNIMNISLDATKIVSDRFSNEVENPKENTQPAYGRCSSAGKYSTLYTCGPRTTLTVTEIDETHYLNLNNKALKIYKESGYFTDIDSTQPRQIGLDLELTGAAESTLKDTELECYYVSNYVLEKRTATFSWGCKLVTNNRYF